MSTKHIRTTTDLARFGASLKIDCTSCGAARTMGPSEAVQSCGPRPLSSLPARLKCGRCGVKGARVTVLPPI
jgi:hypothetical protein